MVIRYLCSFFLEGLNPDYRLLYRFHQRTKSVVLYCLYYYLNNISKKQGLSVRKWSSWTSLCLNWLFGLEPLVYCYTRTLHSDNTRYNLLINVTKQVTYQFVMCLKQCSNWVKGMHKCINCFNA